MLIPHSGDVLADDQDRALKCGRRAIFHYRDKFLPFADDDFRMCQARYRGALSMRISRCSGRSLAPRTGRAPARMPRTTKGGEELIDVAIVAGHSRRALLSGLLALFCAQSRGGVPGWEYLPQGMAETGPDWRTWALSLADPYIAGGAALGYDFGEYPRDLAGRAGNLKMLRSWWAVHDRAELLRQIDGLRHGGHQALYDELLLRLRRDRDGGWLTRGLRGPTNRVEMHRIEVVQRESTALGRAGIVAFDISRCVNLARSGHQVGFLSESEAWRIIIAEARRAQTAFDSWKAYGRSFLAGRDFWGGATNDGSQSRFVQLVNDLLTRPDGAWRIHPWRMPLDGTPIRGADPMADDR